MKELIYKRPDIEKIKKKYSKLLNDFNNVENLDEQLNIIKSINKIRDDYFSMYYICYINFLLDVSSKYWEEESNYYSKCDPIIDNYKYMYYKELLKSKYKKDLKKIIGTKVFEIASLQSKIKNDKVASLLEKESKLSNLYIKIISSRKVIYNNEEMSLTMLEKYIKSSNRSDRIRAQKIKEECLEDIEVYIDSILNDLVKVRNMIANQYGFKSYADYSYINMKRIGYGKEDVALFRSEVLKYVVPSVTKLKEKQRQSLDVLDLYYYDECELFSDGGSVLNSASSDETLSLISNMYKKMSTEIYKVFKYMIDNDLMDTDSRENKRGGGITTFIPKYKVPIFVTNFNNTSNDIKVLLHEFGHAFQLYSSKKLMYFENWWPTFDTCEIHSKSMELLSLPYLDEVFKETTDKYRYEQLNIILDEICYVCLIDEFQHVIYEESDLNIKMRKDKFRELEKKYMPWRKYIDNNYLERGNTFQKQSHIFTNPFYYIDYALADTIALQIYNNKDLEQYIKLCKDSGKYSFIELIEKYNFMSPFKEETLKNIINNLNIGDKK